MKQCPFFGICGGCKYDFSSPDYRANKLALVQDLPLTGDAVWIDTGTRRRADLRSLMESSDFICRILSLLCRCIIAHCALQK